MNIRRFKEQFYIYELLPQLFTHSAIVTLDFNQVRPSLPEYQNVERFFAASLSQKRNPRLPENRQRFNNEFLRRSGSRYLIGQYLEDRMQMLQGSEIAEEGRTIHLGIDIFTENLEQVYAPCNAEIIAVGREESDHSFGHYVILKPDPSVTPCFILLGHLSKRLPKLGKVRKGQPIAILGDYVGGENGGWSRHLHVQLLANNSEDIGLPPGYSSREDLARNQVKYPDPSFLVFRNK
jgi:murein DD-endopeptidase MepM/ murein hydrolase activator NlpD